MGASVGANETVAGSKSSDAPPSPSPPRAHQMVLLHQQQALGQAPDEEPTVEPPSTYAGSFSRSCGCTHGCK